MAFSVPPLPYAYDALEPHIDKATMEFHHDKHHQAYVDNANAALEGTDLADAPVEEVLKNLSSLPSDKQAGVKRFGSGWAWLVRDGSGLAVVSTANQDSPISEGNAPLLGVDVWEHAYYLHYQNRRPDYIDAWWNVVNWPAVAQRFSAAG